MSNKRYLYFYFFSLAALILLSAYPLIKGVRMAYFAAINGAIEPEQYAKYVVPYTAICVALVLFAALAPLLMKLKRLALPVGTAAAFGIFFVVERLFETIQIRTTGMTLINAATMDTEAPAAATADIWQASLCIASPALRNQSAAYELRESFYYVIENSTYKIHYYMVSLIMIAMVCGLVYGIGKTLRSGGDKKPLILRGMSVAALVALCVFANTTAFFREAAPIQTPLASVLTCLFFVILGASAGVYAGSFLTGRKKPVAIALPVGISLAVTVLMYIGEAVMMQGNLYRFGTGWFYGGLPGIVLAPADVLVVLLSGVVALLILGAARRLPRWPGKWTAIIAAALCAGIAVSGVALSAPAQKDEDGGILGVYEFAECIYMNPLSSFYAYGKLPYVYELTDDKLIIANTESGDIQRIAVTYVKMPVAEDAFEQESKLSFPELMPDLSAYKERYLLAIGTNYCLYGMDGELWLGELRDIGIWSIYRIEKTDAVMIDNIAH